MKIPSKTAQPTTFRIDRETDDLLDALAASLGIARVQVLRIAVRDLARSRNMPTKGPR